MTALATAFASVWIALVLYVGWIRRNHRQLADRLQELAALDSRANDTGSRGIRAA
jgi:hypothetical protein